MTEILLIAALVAFRELARSLPAIIWAVRCAPDSPNFTVPVAPRTADAHETHHAVTAAAVPWRNLDRSQ